MQNYGKKGESQFLANLTLDFTMFILIKFPLPEELIKLSLLIQFQIKSVL